MVQHSKIPVYVCNLSNDAHWLAFKGDLGTLRTQIYAAPLPPEGPVPPDAWIPITGGDAWDDLPRWSSDGRLIYFFSDRDGFRCIWARRFDPAAQQPVGEVFPVQHFHQIRLSLSNLSLSEFELDAAPGKLVFPLSEISGNIWMITPVSPHTATPTQNTPNHPKQHSGPTIHPWREPPGLPRRDSSRGMARNHNRRPPAKKAPPTPKPHPLRKSLYHQAAPRPRPNRPLPTAIAQKVRPLH